MDTMPSGEIIRYWRAGLGRTSGWCAALGEIEVGRPTKREATDALMAAVWRALSGSYEPIYIEYVDYRAIVYRTPRGWQYRIGPDCNDPDDLPVTVSCGDQTREQTIRSARKHLAQNAYPWRNGLDFFLSDGSILPDDMDAMRDHAGWVSWQRAFKAEQNRLADLGETDEGNAKAHAYASRNAHAYGSWLTDAERQTAGL